MVEDEIYPREDDDEEVLEIEDEGIVSRSKVTIKELLDKIKELGILLITLDGDTIYEYSDGLVYDETEEYFNVIVKDAYIEIVNDNHARVDIISIL